MEKRQDPPLSDLKKKYGNLRGVNLLEKMLIAEFTGDIAVSSSFGAEAAVLLHMVSQVDRHTPVIFLDTGHLFSETIEYKETLQGFLGLTNIQIARPDPVHIENADPKGDLWQRDHDYCCHLRKAIPLDNILKPFKAWVTGRKRYQSDVRASLQNIEKDREGRVKVNPLFDWSAEEIKGYQKKHNLPYHPLVGKGYPSIGCLHCTSKVKEGEDQRSGRWPGMAKSECGIHF
jgi:phosphoadenosine phosphosulfate reductase